MTLCSVHKSRVSSGDDLTLSLIKKTDLLIQVTPCSLHFYLSFLVIHHSNLQERSCFLVQFFFISTLNSLSHLPSLGPPEPFIPLAFTYVFFGSLPPTFKFTQVFFHAIVFSNTDLLPSHYVL